MPTAIMPGLYQRQKSGVANAPFVTRSTNALEFMTAITSKVLGVANAHWPRFERLTFPTPSDKHHANQW